MKRKKIIVLGAGLSGLAAGEILSQHFDVKIYESAPFTGGLAATFEHNQKRIPFYYHHIIKSNLTTQKYLWKFGKTNKLAWQKIKVGIGINKKLYNINNPIKFLKFKYLNFPEKIRFGLFGLYTLFLMNPNKIKEEVNAEIWLNKYAGKRVTQKIFSHLYSRNKFNIPLNRISAKQFAHRLYEKEIYDFFSFPKESYQPMIAGLETSIKNNNGKVKTTSKITKIDLKEKYLLESGKRIDYDLLISSIPFPEFIRLSVNLPENLKKQISKIKYCPAVGLCFSTTEFLDKEHYWINLFNERIHMIMQHSILCDIYGEKISWCLRYGGSEEDLKLNDKKIQKEYLAEIKNYFPQAKINWVKVFKTKYAEPIYDIDYHKYMPDFKTLVDGLYFTGIQLTHPKIRNMNVALQSGEKVAKIILKEHQLS